MRHAIGLLALAASAVARPQGVAEGIAPSAPPPSGCSEDYPGNFQITVVNVTTSASKLRKRQGATPLELTLNGGVLKDSQGRTGSIVANYQFQFDGPPQAGAIYTGGFSVCGNGTMALGGSAIFYQCYSGGFYNLYDRHWADQCSPIYIEVIGHSSSASGGSSGTATQAADGQPGVASQIPDGQVQATPAPVGQIGDGQVQMAPPAVGQIGDGQVQAGGVSQIADGQVQATPAGQISDGQVQATPAGQIGDGQVQASPAAPAPSPAGQIGDGQVQASPVGQISDGQVQATSAAAAPVGQIGDGQVQASSAAVGQIGDGQVQASAPAVGQASEGKVQATSATSPAVQIGDGQVQQQASATATGGPVQQTVNAAPGLAVELPAAVAGLLAAVALL